MSTTLHELLAEEEIINLSQFRESLKNASSPVPVYKEALGKINDSLDERFKNGEDIRKLIYGRAWEIDRILVTVWEQYEWPADKIALVAVGGYGRGELHPRSDVDLLILLADDIDAEQYNDSISSFLTLLWDINLDIGSSVRTMSECFNEAQSDVTIATNLIESRTLTGNENLHTEMYDRVTSEGAWTDKEFFLAKLKEQKNRHEKTNNTEYNLEPNLKNSPGGLRDLQTIGWVAKRHFGSTYIRDLVADGFLTESELDILNKGELYLWSVRYALHLVCNRKEDRLLFDHQRSLAELFGYKDEEGQTRCRAVHEQVLPHCQ